MKTFNIYDFSSFSLQASRGGSTSSGEASDSSSNSNSTDGKSLQEINADDLNAILPSTDNASSNLQARTTLSNNAEDNASSSDMELPALVSEAIRRVESESDAESARAVPRMQYNSSLLQDFVAKTQMLGNGSNASNTENCVKNGAKVNVTQQKKRGRPKQNQQQLPQASTSNGSNQLGNGLVSESPDSGILSTVSPAPSPRVTDAMRSSEVPNSKQGSKKTKKPETPTPKFSLANSYPTERVLYPPRRKKGSNRSTTKEKTFNNNQSKDDTLDPVWKKIDLNKKFREPCLDGYKSDGGHSICCSKRLAANSGYVSDYYGNRGKRNLSGYKTDHSVKSRRSGYRTDFSSRAKSCGYRSDCSIRHRKKVRRKRRKKIGLNSKSAVDELSDILQLGALTLGTSSNTSSSRESIPSTKVG